MTELRALASFSRSERARIRVLLTDIDDTLTDRGRLPAASYGALERLRQAGLLVIPVTGRPAGWCDLIARQWPVDGVVGENGALYFRYIDAARRMVQGYAREAALRAADRRKLDLIRNEILAAVPGSAVASDQPYRIADLAIDYCEDVARLPPADIDRIVAIFRKHGATAKVSSIHVNGWFGEYDKLTMTRRFLGEALAIDMDASRETIVFVGDSPNDAPMFAFFPHSVGVANVLDFAHYLPHKPAWVTKARGALGFVELAEALLAARCGMVMISKKKPKKSERQARILGELRASPAIRISALAGEFGVSTETIRRDLDELSQQGMLSRTYGGAAARPFGAEPALSERYKEFVEERERVGALAARAIEPGQVLMIDAGSTTLHFARRLSAELNNLTVITNSFGIASVLSTNQTIHVVVCPGSFDPREASVFGSDSETFLRRFNANIAVIGCSGLTADGPNDVNPNSAAIKRAMLSRAEANMLLVDHSKFDLLTLENVCPLDAIKLIVADRAPTGELARAIKRAGLPVEIATATQRDGMRVTRRLAAQREG